MKRLTIFIAAFLFICTSCQRVPPSVEPVGDTTESEILLQSEDSAREPAVMEPEEGSEIDADAEEPEGQSVASGDNTEAFIREFDSINLSNATQTEFLYEGKVGDEFLGLSIRSLDYRQLIYNGEWHDQSVSVFFDGEKVVEGYYAPLDGPDLLKMTGDFSAIPDFIEDEQSTFANNMYIGTFTPDAIALYKMADEYIDMNEEEIAKNSDKLPYFYCKLKVDNIRLAWMAESSAGRTGDLLEPLLFEFAGYIEPELFWAM